MPRTTIHQGARNLPALVQQIQGSGNPYEAYEVVLNPGLTQHFLFPPIIPAEIFIPMAAMLMAFAQPQAQKVDLPSLKDLGLTK